MSKKKRNKNAQPAQSGIPKRAAQTDAPSPVRPADRREAQRQARLTAAKKENRRLWIYGLIGVVVVVALVVVVLMISTGGEKPGVSIRNDGQFHLRQGEPIEASGQPAYSSDPPTSGPHWPEVRIVGSTIFDTTQPDEQLVHNLEHGYVILNHNCKQAECPDIYDGLLKVYRKYQSKNKIIMNYRPKTKTKIALTAWTRLDAMDSFNEAETVKFIEAYLDKGPEPGAR